MQVEYSLAERTADRELLPMAEAFGLGAALYGPLAGGLLTGKYRSGGDGRLSASGDAPAESARTAAVLDAVLAVAEETGRPPPRCRWRGCARTPPARPPPSSRSSARAPPPSWTRTSPRSTSPSPTTSTPGWSGPERSRSASRTRRAPPRSRRCWAATRTGSAAIRSR
ncbi:aldo/keto reductase [Streptomyces sp. M19]